jgi:phage terminase small subunit
MPRSRDPNRDKAFEIYKEHEGNITNREIANMLTEKENTISNWKCRDKWDSKIVCSTTKKDCSTTNKYYNKKRPIEDKKEVITVEPNQVIENSNLTEKQRLFVAEYLKDFNATRAAMTVGYSKDTSYSIGFNLLKKVEVQAEIKRQTEVLFDSIGLTQQRILMEYMKMAHADISDYLIFGQKEIPVIKNGEQLIDENGQPVTKLINYVDFKESSEVDTSLIQEVKQGKDGISIKLYDKQKAMDTLAKYMNIISGGIQVNIQQNSINVTLEDEE